MACRRAAYEALHLCNWDELPLSGYGAVGSAQCVSTWLEAPESILDKPAPELPWNQCGAQGPTAVKPYAHCCIWSKIKFCSGALRCHLFKMQKGIVLLEADVLWSLGLLTPNFVDVYMYPGCVALSVDLLLIYHMCRHCRYERSYMWRIGYIAWFHVMFVDPCSVAWETRKCVDRKCTQTILQHLISF